MGWLSDTFLGPISSAAGALFQNQEAKDAAATSMRFQERMSSTSYQRAVKDLGKAGLNPMLAYGQGGAQGGAGATYVPQNVGASSAEGASRSMERRLMESNIRLNEAKVDTETAQQRALFHQGSKTQAESMAQNWVNHTNFGPVWDSTSPKVGSQSIAALEAELKNKLATKDLILGQTASANASAKASLESVNKMVQDIAVGRASVDKLREETSHIKVLIENSKLDQSQKKAYAQAWDDMGKGGAFAKEAVPFLRMLFSMIGK